LYYFLKQKLQAKKTITMNKKKGKRIEQIKIRLRNLNALHHSPLPLVSLKDKIPSLLKV